MAFKSIVKNIILICLYSKRPVFKLKHFPIIIDYLKRLYLHNYIGKLDTNQLYPSLMLAFLNNGFPSCKLNTCKNHICKVSATMPYHFNDFCSKHCQNTYNGLGERNPNYGNKWNQQQRQHLSQIVIQRMKNDYYRYVANQPKSKETIKSKHDKLSAYGRTRVKDKNSFYNKHHSNSTRKKWSQIRKSPEYQARRRKQCEELGLMIPLSQKTDYEIYYNMANWKHSMFDLIKNQQQLQLLKTHKVFNSRTNVNGVVRDHIYSRFSGFNEGVFPELLRHPANCQLLLNTNNLRKSCKNKCGPDHQTKEELFEKIKSYKGNWLEQKLCIKLIQDYESGKRWSNPYSVNK